jgi:uncharacterized SAM-binding protein YcdF (DUF218 family)
VWGVISGESAFSFVMPPTVFISVCLAAALLSLARPRAGIVLMLMGSILLYVSAMPAVATSLLREIDDQIPTGQDLRGAQAIVILSADLQLGNGSNEPDTIGPITLKRVAFGARLYHIVHLPVLVSGGHIEGSTATLGALMRDELEQNFAVPVTWNEERSRTTYENAVFSAQLLKPANVTSVLLVTSPAHMPRALWSFEHVGLHAIPWPTPLTTPKVGHIGAYLPSANALDQTDGALHEILGLIYYRLAY